MNKVTLISILALSIAGGASVGMAQHIDEDGRLVFPERRITAFAYLGADELTIRAAAERISTRDGDGPGSWVYEGMDIQPNFQRFGTMGFAGGEETGRQTVAAVVEGRFDSFFRDRPSPLAGEEEKESEGKAEVAGVSDEAEEERQPVIARVIDHSPESARIILFASNTFLTDTSLDLAASGMGTRYLNPVQLVKNAVDWSLEDRGLLSIRGRTHYSRTLSPLGKEAQVFWEYLNYGLAILGLFVVWILRRLSISKARIRYQAVMNTGRA